MPISRNVKNALVAELMRQRGLRYYFFMGDPVVRDKDGNLVDSSTYHDAYTQAETLFDVMVDAIDFNRLALEAVGAYYAIVEVEKRGQRVREFGEDARLTGRAIRMALTVDDTFPRWDEMIAKENETR